jgi:putative acetyltransferase
VKVNAFDGMGPSGYDGSMRVVVRRESPADWSRVDEIVNDAFGRGAEARLVARLRSARGVLSLVATVDDVVVAHVMGSPLRSQPAADATAYGLAPVSVARAWQRRAIGSRLVRAGLDELRHEGVALVVVLGDPTYYARFGFVAAAPLGLTCRWGGEDGAFQALELVGGAAQAYRGIVEYDDAFDELAG